MSIICCDLETFYDSEFSLSKLSTEEYIRDPRFEVIGCGISLGGRSATWYSGGDVGPALQALPWSSSSLLAFNTVFDGAILAWHYGIRPALYLDAMGMAKACGKTYRGASLSKVAETLGVGQKGDYVVQAKGKRLADFAPHELAAYGAYCCNDVDLTVKIYRLLAPHFPLSETKIQDLNLRLFTEPLLRFDSEALTAYHTHVVGEKQEKLAKVADLLGLRTYDEQTLKTSLASNPQFAMALRAQGVEPPTKLSPKTGKETYAFAKTDPDFMELMEDDDPTVQALVSARLGVRSTIEETRAERFIEISTRGSWPTQYNYYGANTSRFSGAGNANPQNLKRGGKLRYAILPPPGHAILAADLSSVECRVLSYLAMQDDVINAFKLHDRGEGPDVYCIFAEKIYRRLVTPQNKTERTVGKIGELSLGYGAGWKAFKRMLFAQAGGMTMQQSECQGVVDIYRSTHKMVVGLWDAGNEALAAMLRGADFDLGREGILQGTAEGIVLPNGLKLQYPELRQEWDKETRKTEFVYTNRNKPVKIHGAVVIQNCVEALSRLILTDAWLRLAERVRIVMHSHDEIVAVVPYAEVERSLDLMVSEMTREVVWARGLPLACEAKSGATYGDAKR